MRISKIYLCAALIAATPGVFAAGHTLPHSAYAMGGIECTQLNDDHLLLTCKLSDPNTGDMSELNGMLINYDVKNSAGSIVASGYGNTIYIDKGKLAANEEYSVIVYALVNGNVESQTITKRMAVDANVSMK